MMDHPYEIILHRLREYKHLCDCVDSNAALEIAMQIRLEAQKLVVLAAQNVDPSIDTTQMNLDL